MEILDVSLVNFRNFSQKRIVFDKKLTVIIGANGAGKSNILEAVALLCAVKPFRVETDLDLVKFGKEEAKVEGKFELESQKRALTVNFQVQEGRLLKSFFIDSLKKRLVDFRQISAIVVFSPEDLDLVSGSPSLRRHHMDAILSSSDKDYWRNLSSYGKIVVRRNKILIRILEGKSKPGELSFWDQRLVEHASYISKKRSEFFDFINFVTVGSSLGHPRSNRGSDPRVRKGYVKSDLSWKLKQSLVNTEKLRENRERDIAAGATLSGPHRDDFRFFEKEKDLEFFGSRGEQRMSVLYLKLAELEYLAKILGARPILALDDIFSELDWEHRDVVLSIIANQQTIITAAEKESVPAKLLKSANVVEI